MNKEAASDKIAVITGATKGLGRALSFAFAEAGYEVIGIYRSDSAAADIQKAEFQTKKLKGRFVGQDITREGSWAELDEIIGSFKNKRITLIANACPPFVPKPLHFIDWEEVSSLVDTNLKGTFLLFKRLLPSMLKARQGTIVSILTAALDSTLPPKGFGAYVAAKFALEGLTKAIAAEYQPRGIRVFSVSPDFMETSLTDGWSEHLKALIRPPDRALSHPDQAALRIFSICEDARTTGRGENYRLGGF